MKTTTISIHVPLTDKVLEGLEDDKEYFVMITPEENSRPEEIYRGRLIKYIVKNYKGAIKTVLIERTITEEEIKKQSLKWCQENGEKGRGTTFVEAVIWALSLPE